MSEEQSNDQATETEAEDQPTPKAAHKNSPVPDATNNDGSTPDVTAPETARNEPPPQDPRRRLRELLAIPDHQRTDAIWDEIIELEICLAPGNRIQGAQAEPGRRQGAGQGHGQGQGQGRRPEQQRRADQTPGAKPSKRFFKKPKRPQGTPPKT